MSATPRTSFLAVVATLLSLTGPVRADDDRTFRPTVLIRQGSASGSGTVIASIPGETLVLTAAHVVASGGTPIVEVHRFNLGLERSRPSDGWPVRLTAEVVASDNAADVAILRIRGKAAMPFVAGLVPAGETAKNGAVVTSLGIDGGDHLSSWAGRIVETSWFVMEPVEVVEVPVDQPPSRRSERYGRRTASAPTPTVSRPPLSREEFGRSERPFLITTKAPKQGRSGGGLFDARMRLVGVCVGRLEAGRERGRGVFASADCVRRLLREHDLEGLLTRSETYQAEAGRAPAQSASSISRSK